MRVRVQPHAPANFFPPGKRPGTLAKEAGLTSGHPRTQGGSWNKNPRFIVG